MGTQYEIKRNEENEAPELSFVAYREKMKEDEKLTFNFDRMAYNDKAGKTGEGEVVTLINTATAEAIAVWVTQHPEALFEQEVTDGQRLINALIRAFEENLSGLDAVVGDALAAIVNNENGGALPVQKVELDSGFKAWRWTVTKA